MAHKQQTYFVHCFGDSKSKIRVPAWPYSGEDFLPRCRLPTSQVSSHGESCWGSTLYLFYKAVISIHEVPPSSPNLVQFSSVTHSCPTLCHPMDCSTWCLPVHHQLPELTQNHVHWVSDAIQPSHPLSSLSPPTFNLSQHQGLFKWVSSSHQVAKVLEFQFQHQSFQWIFRTDFP